MDRQEFEQMTPEKLLDKITELNKRLFKMNQRSPMYNQMRAIIAEAQTVYQEGLQMARFEAQNEERDEVINIGDIESEVYTPDYGNTTVLDTMVKAYTGGNKDASNS
jgi:hypothetical protein